jgi:HD-GYP domain-containing protein (c-di-GMP phosphodiesterase class II)
MNESSNVARKVIICVIDGNPEHQADFDRALTSFYQIAQFQSPAGVIERLAAAPPAAIVLDEDIAPAGGLAVLKSIRAAAELADVPIILTSPRAESEIFEDAKHFGVEARLLKPFKRGVLLDTLSKQVNRGVEDAWEAIEPVQQAALKQTVSTFNDISDLIDKGEPLPYDSVKASCQPLVTAVSNNDFKDLLKGVRGHDNYSYVHSLRVATLLSMFGTTIGIKGDDLLTLATGGLLHDVGKMSIPHTVLNKPGKLEGNEWDMMKSHVSNTVIFLENSPDMPRGVMTIASQHHEKLDGTGYPAGIKGGDLNDLARMATIADIFSALTDRRVYKDPMPPEKALAIMTDMKDGVDQHFLMLFQAMLMDAASGLDDP